MNVFDLSAKITMDVNGYLKGMDQAQAVAISTVSVIGGQLDKFMSDSLEVGKQFDRSMGQVSATLGKTMDEVGQDVATTDTQFGEFTGTLREFAQFMGENTVFSATQCAQALNYMALAGYDTQKSMEMLPNVLNLAAAGSMDLARASDMVTDTQTAFGLSADRTKRMVDEMAKAASTGNTSVEQLGEAFLRVGPLARNLNNGLVTMADGTQVATDGTQELETAFVAMANAGIKGSEAGTHMRNMLMKLTGPTDDGAVALEEMGVKVFDASGKMRALSDVFGDLNKAMSTMTQESRIAVIQDLFNARDLASAESILSAIGSDWDRIGAAIQEADGAAAQMAETQLDNLAGDITLFNSALEGLQIKLSDSAMPAMRDFTQLGTTGIGLLTDAFSALPDQVQTVTGLLLTGIGKVGAALPTIMGLTSALSQMRAAAVLAGDASGGLAGTLMGLAGPAAIAVGAIAAVTAIVISSKKDIDDFTAAAQEVLDKSTSLNADLKTDIENVHEWVESEDKYSDVLLKYSEASEKAKNAKKGMKEADKALKEAEEGYQKAVNNSSAIIEKNRNTTLNGINDLNWFGDVLNTVSQGSYGAYMGYKMSEEEISKYADAVAVATENQELAAESLRLNTNEAAVLSTLVPEMTDHQREYTQALVDMIDVEEMDSETVTKLTNNINRVNEEYSSNTSKVQEYLQINRDAQEELRKEHEETYKQLGQTIDGMTGLLDKIEVKTDVTVTDIIGNLNSHQKYMDDYLSNLEKAVELHIDEGLLQTLADGSQESAEILAAIVKDGGKSAEALNEAYRKQIEKKEQFQDTLFGFNDDYGKQMEYLEGEQERYINMLSKYDEAYDSTMDTMKGELEAVTADPLRDQILKEFQDLGVDGTQFLDLYDAAYKAGKNTIAGYLTYLNLDSVKKMVAGAFEVIGNISVKALNKSIGANSPAKKFIQSSKYAMDGVVVGVESNLDEVADAYTRAGETAQDAYNATLGSNPFSVYENPSYGQTDVNAGGSRVVFAGDMKIEISGVDGKTADEIVDILEERIYENARKEQMSYGLA